MVIHKFSFGLLQEPIVLGQYSSSADFIARRKYSSHAALEVLLLSMESQHATFRFVSDCVSAWPSVHDEHFVTLRVGVHDELNVTLVFSASFTAYADQRL